MEIIEQQTLHLTPAEETTTVPAPASNTPAKEQKN